MTDWKTSFLESIQQGSVDGLIEVFRSQATIHAGTAPSKIKNYAVRQLRSMNTDKLYPLILQLCAHENPTAQEVGAISLTDFYPIYSTEVNRQLYVLADSDNWEVREWVATACGFILEKHFDGYFPAIEEWSRDASENIRRAAILAVMHAGKSRNQKFIEPILDVLTPLLSDRSRYVRDNLGPFAIGSALIKYYPSQVLKRLDTWIEDEDEQVRWNIAMIFSAAEGARFAQESKHVFGILTSDERPYVKKAVAKAIKNISNRTTCS